MIKVIIKTIFALVILVIVSGLYLLTLKGVYGNPRPQDFKNNLDQATKPLELSPERGRYSLTVSLAQNHSFALSQTLADAVYPDVGYYQGKFYIFFAPGISLMALPLYELGAKFNLAQVFTFSLSIIFALLTEITIYKIGRSILKLPVWASIFAVLIYAFGSNSWSYAVTLYQHQATAFFMFSAIYAAWLFRRGGKFSWLGSLWVWVASALAVSVDYPDALFMMPVIIYHILTSFTFKKGNEKAHITFRPVILLTSIFFAAIMLLHGYYNNTHFGGWTKVSGGIVDYKIIKEAQLAKKSNAQVQQIINRVTVKKDPVKFFSEDKTSFSTYTLFASLDRGLFVYSPIFLLSIFGLYLLIKLKSAESAVLLGSLAVVLFLYSSWGDPWGGWAFGPRYLIPTYPVLALSIAMWLSNGKFGFLKRLVSFPLFIFSSMVALLGVLTTNAVPPKVEADFLHTGYNYYSYNLKFFQDGRSSSFIFNTFLSHKLTLLQYSAVIESAVLLLVIIVLFIMPLFKKYEH